MLFIRYHSLLRPLLLAFMLSVVAFSASAQDGLNINSLFSGTIARDDRAVTTMLSDLDQAGINFRRYRSLSLSGAPDLVDDIEPLVRRDGATATAKEVKQKGGAITYGFYQLPPAGAYHRYILYLNRIPVGGDRILLIYIESKASPEKIRKMLQQK